MNRLVAVMTRSGYPPRSYPDDRSNTPRVCVWANSVDLTRDLAGKNYLKDFDIQEIWSGEQARNN